MPDPVVLGFDTSAAHCAAALLVRDAVVVRAEPMQKGQAERLMPLLQEVLAEGGVGWSDLTAIGVGVGPGNFTGTRIAVSAARGLALGLGVPAVGVTSFEAAAHEIARPITVTVPAMRGQVYAQRFDSGGASAPTLCRPDDLAGPVIASPPPGDLAAAIARIAAGRAASGKERPAPLYIRPADAAPPREAPPAILP